MTSTAPSSSSSSSTARASVLDFSDDDVDDEIPPVTTTPTANSANLSGSPAVLAIAAVGEMFAASEEEIHVLENMTALQLSLLAVATAARLESIETKINLLCAARSSGNGAEVNLRTSSCTK
mmetsp:Transcript_53930/g.108408  ORF Transcript_53930/g.108408 Transcript_53930/m.108408 type:complete len:122 (-) Transcript_53930:73-438(-)